MSNSYGNSTVSLVLTCDPKKETAARPSELEIEILGLFDELRDRLLRYLLSIGLPVSDGEEIVQEAFLSLFLHLQRGRSRENLRGWLFRVARNQALKRLAADKRRSDVLGWDNGASEAVADTMPDPEQQAAWNQHTARLHAVLQALPSQDQECLGLRAEGLKYREIAEALGISLGSVSASLARSLARFQRASRR